MATTRRRWRRVSNQAPRPVTAAATVVAACRHHCLPPPPMPRPLPSHTVKPRVAPCCHNFRSVPHACSSATTPIAIGQLPCDMQSAGSRNSPPSPPLPPVCGASAAIKGVAGRARAAGRTARRALHRGGGHQPHPGGGGQKHHHHRGVPGPRCHPRQEGGPLDLPREGGEQECGDSVGFFGEGGTKSAGQFGADRLALVLLLLPPPPPVALLWDVLLGTRQRPPRWSRASGSPRRVPPLASRAAPRAGATAR